MLPVELGAGEDSIEARLRKSTNDKASDFWVYDDMEAAKAQANSTGKPLLVTVRCIP